MRILQKGTTLSLASPTLVRDLLDELRELGEQGELWRAGRLRPEAWEPIVKALKSSSNGLCFFKGWMHLRASSASG